MPARQGLTIEERVLMLEHVTDRLEALAERTDTRMDRIERVIWQGVAVVSVLLVLANIIGPVIADKLSQGL